MNTFGKSFLAGMGTLALSLGSSGCAPYQQKPAPVATMQVPASEASMGGPALWRVADEDTTIYIFGTVHALPDDIDWYTGPVKTALDSSQTLVTEVDMTEGAAAEIQGIFLNTSALPSGTTVRSLLSQDQLTAYEAKLAELGIPANAFDAYEPWAVSLSISQIAFQRAGITGENGTEKVLEDIIGDRMGRGSLETAASQFAIFDELPMQAQVDYMMETLEGIDELAPMLQQMIDEWAEGDVDNLGALLNDALEADPVLANRLLYARNANWAVWIDDRLDQPGTIFMAVGAGHLAGRESLQEKLAERNIAITRIQ